jgi:D-alanyl-D-alanine carboxypeptidase/D-alanyl-D-alanine-endopeptidase (penicillin-binding protein 4)
VAHVPASNQKLLLAMALFDNLGQDFRIPTIAAARRPRGSVLEGDLWVVGRGDPTLTDHQPWFWGSSVRATTLADLAARIKSAGIETIDGRIMGATGYFAHDLFAPGWQPYVARQYVELPASLSMNGNFSGTARPERAVAAALGRELERAGVTVRGSAGSGKPPAVLTRVAAVRSVPLAKIVAFMNQTSNNFFAEMLGKLLGATRYGPPGTIRSGARAVESWVRSRGLDTVAHDSSGLSYKNRVSARTMVRLLALAEGSPWLRALRSGLPAAGEGTLLSRLSGVNLRAKTGTLFNGASALSGWIRRPEGRGWIEFSILGHGTPKTLEDGIVRVLARAPMRLRYASRRRASEGCPGPRFQSRYLHR